MRRQQLASTLFALEDWPINHMALFPFNAEQMERLDKVMDSLSFCCGERVVTLKEAVCDPAHGLLWPEFIWPLLYEDAEAARQTLASYMTQSKCFLHPLTLEPVPGIALMYHEKQE